MLEKIEENVNKKFFIYECNICKELIEQGFRDYRRNGFLSECPKCLELEIEKAKKTIKVKNKFQLISFKE